MFLSTVKDKVFSPYNTFCSPVGESVADTPLSQKMSSSWTLCGGAPLLPLPLTTVFWKRYHKWSENPGIGDLSCYKYWMELRMWPSCVSVVQTVAVWWSLLETGNHPLYIKTSICLRQLGQKSLECRQEMEHRGASCCKQLSMLWSCLVPSSSCFVCSLTRSYKLSSEAS